MTKHLIRDSGAGEEPAVTSKQEEIKTVKNKTYDRELVRASDFCIFSSFKIIIALFKWIQKLMDGDGDW